MSAKYTVHFGFVDTTYWDDGSRWARRTFEFKTQKDAIDFAHEASTKGTVVRGLHGDLHVRPGKNEITVERHTTTEVKWQAQPSGGAVTDSSRTTEKKS